MVEGHTLPERDRRLSAATPAPGLLETMLGVGARAPWLARHLERLVASAATLGLRPTPGPAAAAAVEAALADGAGPARRVRLIAPPGGPVQVECRVEPSLASLAPAAAAATSRGGWDPDDRRAEHKITDRARHDEARRLALQAGADFALLLDQDGRLGEACVANAFCVVDGELVTAPPLGLLPGLARAEIIRRHPVREEALPESAWRAAEEVFLTNALRGVVPITDIDGVPVGDGSVGPVARALAAELAAERGVGPAG